MSKSKSRRAGDLSNRLIEEIVAARPKTALLPSRKKIDAFLRQYFGDVPHDDMQGRSPAIMGQAALHHLGFAESRSPSQAKLRIFNPNEKDHGYQSAYTIVEMVNDDMPFLVDSVSAAITRHGLTIHMTVHPIFRVKRDRRGRLLEVFDSNSEHGQAESYVRFVIDRDADLQGLVVLEHEIAKVLADVRLAVRDWKSMRRNMLQAADDLASLSRADDALRKESESLLRWMVLDHFTFLGFREYRLHQRGQKLFLRPVKGNFKPAAFLRHSLDSAFRGIVT